MPSAFTAAGTAGLQWFVANASAYFPAGAISGQPAFFVQAGVTCVPGTADPLYVAQPAMFTPLSLIQGA